MLIFISDSLFKKKIEKAVGVGEESETVRKCVGVGAWQGKGGQREDREVGH